MQILNPLLELNLNLDVSVVIDHLMTRALEDGTRNLERPTVEKRDILLGSLGDLMRMWFVLLRFSCRV
jgi:hypothetical protein